MNLKKTMNRIKNHEHLRREYSDGRKAGRTAGGSLATVASKRQMRPLRTEIHISEFESITAGETPKTATMALPPEGVCVPNQTHRLLRLVRGTGGASQRA
jgi:hypothetical protein